MSGSRPTLPVGLLVKNLLFTLIVPGTVGVYLPLALAKPHPATSPLHTVLGGALLAAGAGLYLACVGGFAILGRGTPAPIAAPRSLVIRGPYRFSRNAMYLAVLTVIAGWSIWLRAPELVPYAALVALAFQLFVVLYEEPHLTRLFGADYLAYRARTARWLPRSRHESAVPAQNTHPPAERASSPFPPAVALGALLWALSPLLVGRPEPWDASLAYYLGGLVAAGLGLGLAHARPFLPALTGLFTGQLAFLLLFLESGPLLVLGAVFMLAGAVAGAIAAVLGRGLRRAFRRGPAVAQS